MFTDRKLLLINVLVIIAFGSHFINTGYVTFRVSEIFFDIT